MLSTVLPASETKPVLPASPIQRVPETKHTRTVPPPAEVSENVVVLFHADLGQQLPDIAPPPRPTPAPQRQPYGYD